MLDRILAGQLYGGNGWRIAATRATVAGIEAVLVPTRESAVCAGCGETKRRCHDTRRQRVAGDTATPPDAVPDGDPNAPDDTDF
jgi:hypothetical protein